MMTDFEKQLFRRSFGIISDGVHLLKEVMNECGNPDSEKVADEFAVKIWEVLFYYRSKHNIGY